MKRAKYLGYSERRDPKEISDVLGSVIERASVNIDVRQGDLVARWKEVAPGEWAEVARPVGIREQTLLVEVGSGTAGSVLKYQTQHLLDAIAEEFGADLVTSVRLQIPRSQERP